MSIGERIQLSRKIKNLSQTEFGELIDSSQKQVSKYERNILLPPTEKIIKICEVLNISADWLLLGDRENEPKRPEIEFYEKLTYPQIKIIEMLNNEDYRMQLEIMHNAQTYLYLVQVGKEKAKEDGIDLDEIIREMKKERNK